MGRAVELEGLHLGVTHPGWGPGVWAHELHSPARVSDQVSPVRLCTLHPYVPFCPGSPLNSADGIGDVAPCHLQSCLYSWVTQHTYLLKSCVITSFPTHG